MFETGAPLEEVQSAPHWGVGHAGAGVAEQLVDERLVEPLSELSNGAPSRILRRRVGFGPSHVASQRQQQFPAWLIPIDDQRHTPDLECRRASDDMTSASRVVSSPG
jgi:hypothetical protein